jgi:hypothetical protein
LALNEINNAMENINLKPGDVFLTRGKGFLAFAIRICSTTIGEKRSKVNHVGLIVEGVTLQTCIEIEASYKVQRCSFWKVYGPKCQSLVAIFRPTNLSEKEINVIINEAAQQVGKTYGYFKILAHFLDWMLLGAYFFRRFFKNNKYPICSWLVAHAFAKAGKYFGVAPGAAQPDDIWDFMQKHPTKYQVILPLSSIWK